LHAASEEERPAILSRTKLVKLAVKKWSLGD